MIAWEESPRQFKMSKQLDEGKFGEDLAHKFLNDPIIKVNHGISHYDDVTQDKSYQDKDARHLKIKEGQSYRIEDPRYAEHVKYLWLTADDNSDVKVYDQKRLVEYADYKPGMLYVSVYEVFPAGEGH